MALHSEQKYTAYISSGNENWIWESSHGFFWEWETFHNEYSCYPVTDLRYTLWTTFFASLSTGDGIHLNLTSAVWLSVPLKSHSQDLVIKTSETDLN